MSLGFTKPLHWFAFLCIALFTLYLCLTIDIYIDNNSNKLEEILMKTLLTNSKTLIASALIMGVALAPMTSSAFSSDNATGEYQQQNKKGQKKGHKQFKRMAKYLQLTDAQRTEIKTIREGFRVDKSVQKSEMQSFRADIKTLIASGDFTDQGFADLYAQHEDGLEQKALNKAKMQNAIYQVLTEEQKIKWQAFKGKNKSRK